MKKILIAAVCGLCLLAAGAVMGSNDSETQMAGSGGAIHVMV